MTSHRYPTLLVAALTAAFFGAAVAQTQSDDSSRMPAKKGTAQESQTQPSTDQTDKMKGQSDQTKDQTKSQASSAYPSTGGTTDQKADKKSAASDQSGKQSMAQPSEKAKPGDQQTMKSDQSAKTGKSAGEHTAMSDQKAKTGMKQGAGRRQGEEAASPDEKAYREALRDCVKQQDQNQRNSCLDSAIEKFHRNA
jgi:hypothetical protein